MFHLFMLQVRKCILVQVVPNLCEQHQFVDILIHVVILLLRVDIVYIPHRLWHSLRLDEPSEMLCGRVCIRILIIRLIVTVIVTWK